MSTTRTEAGARLDASFRGEQIHPQDRDYDAARTVHNGGIDKRPAVVLRPRGTADVVDAVRYAREAGLPLAVRCGGEGVAGTATIQGGVLLDLSALRGVHLNLDRGTALAQGGTLWGEYDRETQLLGRATPGGLVSTAGLGGFLLGGGYGWLSPVHGLACDNLVAADLVTAGGRYLRVSEDEHPDLFWALRGAGANFGVVTSYELRTHAVGPQLLGGMLVVPNDDRAGEATRAYRDAVEGTDQRLVTALATFRCPADSWFPAELVGRPVVAVILLWVGTPADGADAFRELRTALPGAVDLVRPTTYTAFQGMLDAFSPRGWRHESQGHHLASLPDDVLDEIVAQGRDIGSPMTRGIVLRNGGAIARTAGDATAAGHRTAPYLAHARACWATPLEDAREREWVRRFADACSPAATGGRHLGYESGTDAATTRSGYDEETLRRLTALKDEWDPDNLFRSNHNLTPTGWQPSPIPRQTRR